MGKKKKTAKTVKQEFPARTVSMISLFRVMPQMPRKKGVRYEFDSFFPISGSVEKPADGKRFAIVYVGQEDIKIGDETLNCQCYDLLAGELILSLERRAIVYPRQQSDLAATWLPVASL